MAGPTGSSRVLAAAAALALAAGCATTPPEPRQTEAAYLALCYLARAPVEWPDRPLSIEEARDLRRRALLINRRHVGRPVGHKAALTSAAARERFGAGEPVRGVLAERMLHPGGAVLAAPADGRMLVEADLVVRVGNVAALERAAAVEDVPAGLAAAYPFIELPDLAFAPGRPPDAALLTAVNAGARAGVLGPPIPMGPGRHWADRLARVRVERLDGEGEVEAEGEASAILGHPLQAVLWLRDDLREEGIRLRKGDLLSLGTILAPVPAEPGQTVRFRYVGLDPVGPVEVSVRFE